MSLSAYVRRAFPAVPAYVVREALKRRDIRVNGARSGAEAVVRGGDELKLYIDEKYFSSGPRVLFEDAGLLVLEKPQGLPVDADASGVGADTLLSRARESHPSARLLHRLDTGAGGAVLFSLNDAVREAFLEAFRAGTLGKEYALCALGTLPAGGRLVSYIQKDAAASRVRAYDSPAPGAKRAELSYERLRTIEREGMPLSFARVDLLTGRTHQIRAQFAQIGYPLAGDDAYGDREKNALLHARMPSLWCRKMTLAGEMLPKRYRGLSFESEPQFPLWKRYRNDEDE